MGGDRGRREHPDPGLGTRDLRESPHHGRSQAEADLTWTGASGAQVDVFRNGAKLVTTENDGAYTDNINATGSGSYRYKVCEAGTSTCSAEAVVTFG